MPSRLAAWLAVCLATVLCACTSGNRHAGAQGGSDAALLDGGGEASAVGRALELEHRWRQLGNEADGREALAGYHAAAAAAAAREARDPVACDAALRGAHLAGDLSHDAEAAYEELYRARRRFEARDPGCTRSIDDALSLLAAFRPSQAVLDAIDVGLAAEGVPAAGVPSDPATSARAPVAGPRPPQVSGIEAWPSPDAARVVVVLDRSAAYRVADDLTPSGGVRTVLDLDGVDLGGAPRELSAAGIVTRVRAGAAGAGVRVAIELDGRAWRRVFALQDPFRIVIDIARHPPRVRGRNVRDVARVVLDPGHGGKDVGAIGWGGVREKDVTLDVVHRVAPVLASQGIEVVLTRDDDTFVSLEERTARANAVAADLFVSVHCNASESRAPHGIETYVLDTSRDEIAARIAARENATTEAATAELAAILGGMRMADEGARSRRFAHLLQRSAIGSLRMRYPDVIDGGVHTAGFYVLVGARMPSVLFEASYLSNAVDEQRLGSSEGRQAFADAIVNAVRAYREGR